MTSGRTTYWTRTRVLARLRRAVREVYENDSTRLSTSGSKWTDDIRPFNEGYSHCRPLYPGFGTVCRVLGGMQKAWKLLGHDVQVVKYRSDYAHEFTKEIDDKLREIYSRPAARFGGNNFRAKGQGVKAYAAELGWPHHVLVHRASQLGIARVKEKPWSNEELAALRQWAHFSPPHIERLFKKAGFKRSEASIACMRKKSQAFKTAPWYSATSLAVLMGVDAHMVTDSWLPKGLKFIWKGSNRRAQWQGGDVRLFHQKEIRRFFIEHPEEIDLLKVDKYWFLEMITGGAIKQVVPSVRISKRNEAPRPVARIVPKTTTLKAKRKAA